MRLDYEHMEQTNKIVWPKTSTVSLICLGIILIIFLTSCALDQTKVTRLKDQKISVFSKSCSEKPSCFDYVEKNWLEWGEDNQTKKDQMMDNTEERVYDTIKRELGLEESQYSLSCVECNMDRGGFIKVKGTYQNNSHLEFYYHWGWCSSGGTDCGYDVCLTTDSDELFQLTKSSYCSQIETEETNDSFICKGEAFDYTEEIRAQCYKGQFEKIQDSRKTFSLRQYSGRCSAEASPGNFSCLEI